MISNARIQELRDLHGKTTPGRWSVDASHGVARVCDGHCGEPLTYHDGSCCDKRSPIGCYVETHADCSTIADEIYDAADAEWICAAHANGPDLLRTVEELRAQLLDACEVAEQLREFALHGMDDMQRLIADHRIHYIEDLRKKAAGAA